MILHNYFKDFKCYILYNYSVVKTGGLMIAFFGVDFPRPIITLFTVISFIPRCNEKNPVLGASSLNVTEKGWIRSIMLSNVNDKFIQKVKIAKSTKHSKFLSLTGTGKFGLHVFLFLRTGFCHGWRSVQWAVKGEIGENISKLCWKKPSRK